MEYLNILTLLHSERPKLHRVFGRSECNRAKVFKFLTLGCLKIYCDLYMITCISILALTVSNV